MSVRTLASAIATASATEIAVLTTNEFVLQLLPHCRSCPPRPSATSTHAGTGTANPAPGGPGASAATCACALEAPFAGAGLWETGAWQ